MVRRKKASDLNLVEVSKKIDEQIEKLDDLSSQYLEAVDASLRHSLHWRMEAAKKTINANKKLLRKLDGGNI